MAKKNMVFSRFGKDFLDKNSKFSSQEFGSVCWNVGIEKWVDKDNKKASYYTDHSLRLSDCNRSISLDLTADCVEDYDIRIQKVDELMSSLENLKQALIDAKEFTKKNKIKTD